MLFQVSAFSTWEKELHKIVFDPRYLLLTSKERKQVFEAYVKERAEEERQERRRELKKKKEAFIEMLSSASLNSKYAQHHSHNYLLYPPVDNINVPYKMGYYYFHLRFNGVVSS